ncbi:MAG: hypothetical protein ABSE49_11945 [Polyangiaceae bacterium]
MTPSTGMENHGQVPTQNQPKKKPQTEPQAAPRPKSTNRGGGHHR